MAVFGTAAFGLFDPVAGLPRRTARDAWRPRPEHAPTSVLRERFKCPRGDDHEFAACGSSESDTIAPIEIVSDLLKLALPSKRPARRLFIVWTIHWSIGSFLC
jgi:hypothetical protein